MRVTVPDASRVTRTIRSGPELVLESPVYVDVRRSTAIYAEGLDVVVEVGPKVWRFTVATAEIALTRARDFTVVANR